MKVIIILAIVIIVLLITLYFLGKICKTLQDDNANLTAELSKQKNISKELMHYAEEMAKINGDKDKVAEKISEAENEEELLNIIAGLVNTNNDQVRDKAKG